MDNALLQKIRSMSAAHILEAGELALPDLIGIDDFNEAAASLAELTSLSADEIRHLAKQSSEKSQEAIVELLRLMLVDMATDWSEDESKLRAKLEVGHKQLVIGPELFYIGALLIAGYIAFVKKGVTKEKKTVTIEEMKDGRKKVTIGTETDILNPLNPLCDLVDKVIRHS
jgi:hypothetical protein